MDQGQIALQLMALYGKLRRATDAQVKQAVKHQIDALVGALRIEERTLPRAAHAQPDRVGAGDD